MTDKVVSIADHLQSATIRKKQEGLKEVIESLYNAIGTLESLYERVTVGGINIAPDRYYISLFDQDGNALNICSKDLTIEDFMMVSNFVEMDAEGKFSDGEE